MNFAMAAKSINNPTISRSKGVPKDLCLHLPPPKSPSTAGQPSISQILTSPFLSASLSQPLAPDEPILCANLAKPSDKTNDTIIPIHGTKKQDKSEKAAKKERPPSDIDSQSRMQIQNYLHAVSGQLKVATIQELEHDYSKPCHIHPDPLIRSHAAKFLFMKSFPRHLSKLPNYYYSINRDDGEVIDIMSFEEPKKIPFLTPRPASVSISVDEDIPELDSSITDSWTCEMNKLWTRANKIVYTDRIARLTCDGNVNEVLLKRNLQEQTANKFRELFASTFWDSKLVAWLHATLLEHLNANFKPVYLDSLQILKHKIPSLIETFYREPRTENKTKPFLNDPLFNTLSHYKLKKLPRKPVFIFVPHAPQSCHQSVRLKYWHSMFASMGKVVTIPINARGIDYVSDILTEIRYLVNEKIRNSKTLFSNRPLVLVGFSYGSLIAAHCALNNQKSICATICLGFPLKSINGIRGELDDPLLELTVPMQFIIGENAVMTLLDDMEDFRERMTKAETSLVVVGGADDKLVVSNLKKRLDCLTQSMVDRCVADEIFAFLSNVLINYLDEIAALDHPKVTIISADLCQLSDPFATPKPKKKASKKRTAQVAFAEHGTPLAAPNGVHLSNTPILKPPPKRKRPQSKLKLPLLTQERGQHLAVPNSSMNDFLTPPPQPPIFPNMCPGGVTPADSPALRQLASKFLLTSDLSKSTSLTPVVPNTKKSTKKLASGNLTLTQSLSSLSPIKEEYRPLHSIPSIQMGSESTLSALLKHGQYSPKFGNSPTILNASPASENGVTSLNVHFSAATSQAQSLTRVPSIGQSSAADQPNHLPFSAPVHKHDTSYSVSETHLLHQSTTRTGRPIIPPKSLDI